MESTVILVWKQGDSARLRFRLEWSPSVAAPLADSELKCRPKVLKDLGAPQIPADLVRTAGTMLYQALEKHESVRDALKAATAAASKEHAPIYFHIDQSDAEAFPWEVLCDAEGAFLSLNDRIPIARVVGSTRDGKEINRTFKLPVKVFAVLSAANVSAAAEWKALYETFKDITWGINIKILVGEPELQAEIAKLAETDKRIEVGYVPADGNELLDQIRSYNPQLLHFFCHGNTASRPHLRIATKADWVRSADEGSISLEPVQFQRLDDPASEICIVVLNCCKSSVATGDLRSLAMSIIDQGPAFPAVIGMREPVSSQDASLFSKAFYTSIFDRLEDFLAGTTQLSDIDWVGAMYAPRAKLAAARGDNKPLNDAAASAKEWTLPVIYIRPEPFRHRLVRKLTEAEQLEMVTKLDWLRQWQTMNKLNPSIPANVLTQLEQEIAQIEAQLAA